MSDAVTLPADLRDRLAAVARRARLMRAARGAGVLVLALALTAGAALLADYLLDLPALVRQVLFALWAALGTALFFGGLVRPLGRRFGDSELAAAVEERYPQLGERLTSAIELTDAPDPRNGDPGLVALLVRDTDKRAKKLNFLPAVPGRAAVVLGGAGVLALVAILAPAVAWPEEYADLARRFLVPWKAYSPYAFSVTPGDAACAKGRGLSFTVTVRPLRSKVPPATSGTLVLVDADGNESAHKMRPAGPGEFTLDLPVTGDRTYHVEARAATGEAPAVSDDYRLTAVTPVELAADSPTVTVTPPAYARAAVEAQTVHGLADLSALRGSAVRFAFRFTRPAVAASLEWTGADIRSGKDGTKAVTRTTTYPLALAEGGEAAELTLPATEGGGYRVVLEAEHGIRTELQGGTLVVRADLPPRVEEFQDRDDLRVVTPYEEVELAARLADDIGLAKADLEYQVKGGEAAREPLPLEPGTRLAAVRHALALKGKVKEGDEVRFRLRVEDNLPKELGGPHVVYHPADRWLTLKVATEAGPLREQEIAAQRDAIQRKIEAIRADLRQESRGLYKVRVESREDPALRPEHRDALHDLRAENKEVDGALRDLAKEAETTPALRPLAELARDVADRQMRQSDQGLRAAGERPEADARDKDLRDADAQLSEALQRLDDLQKANERVARERLDQLKVQELAHKQQELADRAARAAEKERAGDPSAKPEAERLRGEQEKVARDLDRMTEQNPSLKQALEQARAEEAKALADRARELAGAQRDLTDAEKERRRGDYADLERRQRELAARAERLAAETREPARAAKLAPLRPREARDAADALRQGDPNEAARHQDEAARDLERLGNELDAARERGRDPKEAARQLARTQDDLRQRTAEAKRSKDGKPLAERIGELRRQQEQVRKAVEALDVPPRDEASRQEQRKAAERAARAGEFLDKQDPDQAVGRMEQARQALDRLAEKLPGLARRREEARHEAARLRQIQDDVARQAGEASRQAAEARDPRAREEAVRRLNEAGRRQAEVAEGVAKLDAPKMEERKERTQGAVDRALADLMDARPGDVAASQEAARRELGRLEQALAGAKPDDEKARDLAARQKELAAAAARAADPKAAPVDREEMKRKQRQLSQAAQALQAPEAPQRKADAAEAARKAEEAANAHPESAQTRRKMEEAARKLDELARQMSGGESDAARAARLASRQAEAAADGERQARHRPNDADTPEAKRRAREVAEEAGQIRGGKEAGEAKLDAEAALARAAQAAPGAPAHHQAADALRELADKLAGRNDPADKAAEMAREQRDLARRAAEAAPGEAAPAEARKAAARQAELARRAERLDTGKGDDPARAEAAREMAEAAKALESARSPADARGAVEKAAEAADRLARDLAKGRPERAADAGGKKADDASPRDAAREMAREQRELAKAATKAQMEAATKNGPEAKKELKKALDEISDRQIELARKVAAQPAGEAQRAKQQAYEAMGEAAAALESWDTAKARQKQSEAAAALDKMAQQARPRSTARRGPDREEAPRPGEATKEQGETARDLAREQRELRDALREAKDGSRPANNPVADLAREQAAVAREAGELARAVARDQGEQSPASRQSRQAQQSAEQASGRMQNGALPGAKQSGEQTAGQLRKLAQDLAQTPRSANSPADSDPVRQSRDLAKRQEDVNRKLEPLVQDAGARRGQELARQEELRKQADELGKDLEKFAQQSRTPGAQQSAREASGSARQAQGNMQQAEQQGRQGNPGPSQQAQQQAARDLDRAAQLASAAAEATSRQADAQPGEPQKGQPGRPSPGQQAGKSLQLAQGQMAQAQGLLGKGQPQQARQSMQGAAKALQQAARQLARQSRQSGPPQKGQPGEEGASPDGPLGPDARAGANARAVRNWGELPGEARNPQSQQYQEMASKYGEDYARLIKAYFEQIADTKAKK